ncbi:hypothetical protein [Rhizobium lusitanum]|uniref:Uncharacterized protein n=1 Tax=Rhizobium lusitanum TaxID=293958 RepID=A0A1C3XLJ2_9HYPH|nr:hypothetical protein [Rhizobium lusitanum]SCB53089.1 hypothetical protein GA0061101_1624 [Rhizobium lusitanum]
MQLKRTTENIGHATALDRLSKLATRLDCLTGDTQDTLCATEIATSHIVDVLFPGRKASDHIKAVWADDYYQIDARERRHIDFMTTDMVERAIRADRIATELSEELLQLSYEMRAAANADKASDLEGCISAWKAAHAAWIDTEKGGVVSTDTPEADTEEKALLVLASYPCVSLGDIQRKANLFLSNEHLCGVASDYALHILRSFSGGEVAR